MPKELARVSAAYVDVQKRVTPMLENLERLDNNFWNATSGNWGRYYAGVDALADRLKELNVNSAADPKAVSDNEVKTLIKGITTAKADSLAISKEFWTTAKRVDAIRREVLTLEADVLKVIKEKSGFFAKSNSLPPLKKLSGTLHELAAELQAATHTGPHQPDAKVWV
jgi:hypothetical protein